MTAILGLAAAAAAANVLLARALRLGSFSKLGARETLLQAAGFFARMAVIIGGAHAVWSWRGRPLEVAVFIIAAATLQLVGQAVLILKKAAASR